jgi:hypothetical protein
MLLGSRTEPAAGLFPAMGNEVKSFESLALAIPRDIRSQSAVFEGEIVCLDREGKSDFWLVFRVSSPIAI